MGEAIGSAKCKALLEYLGQTMLGHLLDSLIANGMEDYLVATSSHCVDDIQAVLEEKKIQARVVVDNGEGFRAVPTQFADTLDERFLFVCGHHPVSRTHIGAMLAMATEVPSVITTYDNSHYTMDKQQRTIVEGVPTTSRPVLLEVDMTQEPVPDEHFYVRNPYIASGAIVEDAVADGYRHTFSRYLVESWRRGEGLGIVEADCPPEFDYPAEYELIKRSLDERVKRQA